MSEELEYVDVLGCLTGLEFILKRHDTHVALGKRTVEIFARSRDLQYEYVIKNNNQIVNGNSS